LAQPVDTFIHRSAYWGIWDLRFEESLDTFIHRSAPLDQLWFADHNSQLCGHFHSRSAPLDKVLDQQTLSVTEVLYWQSHNFGPKYWRFHSQKRNIGKIRTWGSIQLLPFTECWSEKSETVSSYAEILSVKEGLRVELDQKGEPCWEFWRCQGLHYLEKRAPVPRILRPQNYSGRSFVLQKFPIDRQFEVSKALKEFRSLNEAVFERAKL